MTVLRSTFFRRASRGFTFVEILAAMLFMALVIPVAVRGLLLANRVGIAAERKRVSGLLADRILNEKIVTRDWTSGGDSGDFGEDWPLYRWELVTEDWPEDTMTLVTARVFYSVQGQEYVTELSTLADESDETGSDSTTIEAATP